MNMVAVSSTEALVYQSTRYHVQKTGFFMLRLNNRHDVTSFDIFVEENFNAQRGLRMSWQGPEQTDSSPERKKDCHIFFQWEQILNIYNFVGHDLTRDVAEFAVYLAASLEDLGFVFGIQLFHVEITDRVVNKSL
jgi:hypothetical protein